MVDQKRQSAYSPGMHLKGQFLGYECSKEIQNKDMKQLSQTFQPKMDKEWARTFFPRANASFRIKASFLSTIRASYLYDGGGLYVLGKTLWLQIVRLPISFLSTAKRGTRFTKKQLLSWVIVPSKCLPFHYFFHDERRAPASVFVAEGRPVKALTL